MSQTFGEKAVGLSFNPSGDPTVNRLKVLYAEIIDILHFGEDDAKDGRRGPEQPKLYRTAITQAQGAQMWAVKAVTWKD